MYGMGSWCADCILQGMPSLIATPEDDDFEIHRLHDFAQSTQIAKQIAEFRKLRLHFDPHKVGFGILPWSDTEAHPQNSEIATIRVPLSKEPREGRGEGE